MAVYTVHQPPLAGRAQAEPERFVFVRDGFSFWALLLGPIWMLRHRMWLVLACYVALVVLIGVAMHFVGASRGIEFTTAALLALLIGLEAGTLRRFTLGRRRWSNIGVVVGDDLELAERRFFDAWVAQAGAGRGAVAAPPAAHPQHMFAPDVLGLFPEPGASS